MNTLAIASLLIGLSIHGAPPRKAAETPRPVRVTVELTDGSVVYGTPRSDALTVFAGGRRRDMLLRRVRALRFHDDRETATVTLWNGGQVSGFAALERLRVATALGEVVIPSAATRRVTFSLGGINLAEREYKQACGSPYCPRPPQTRRPQRILGVDRRPDEFIHAHAHGRVVYEFDSPVREFHATAVLYDGYGGTKGKVVFKVFADGELVYTSKPIRHFRSEEVYVRFPEARRVTLVTETAGPPWEDWACWLHPEVR